MGLFAPGSWKQNYVSKNKYITQTSLLVMSLPIHIPDTTFRECDITIHMERQTPSGEIQNSTAAKAKRRDGLTQP